MGKTANTILLVLIVIGALLAVYGLVANQRTHPLSVLLAHIAWFVTALQLRGYIRG